MSVTRPAAAPQPGHPTHSVPRAAAHPQVKPHIRNLPLRVGTRGSPLALWQTRHFLSLVERVCPVLRNARAFEEHAIATSGDRIQDKRLADVGGKGLFAKEIHEALADGRIDFAVHSLKDLETELPPGIVLACTLTREDARDALILGPACQPVDPADPYACLPAGAVLGTASVRRQSQILHARPDLKVEMIRGNVQTRLAKVRDGGGPAASLLALAGLRRLGLEGRRRWCWTRRRWCRPPARASSASPSGPTMLSCSTSSRPSRTGRPRRSARRSARCSRRWTAPAARRSAAMRGCCRTESCT
jgi:hydroxymethylbilane synthase